MKLKDPVLHKALTRSKSLAIPWYLMTSYLYYQKDYGLISDAAFDDLCVFMMKHWAEIEHHHKHLVSFEDLKAGTGFRLGEDDYPAIVKGAAVSLMK